MSGKEAKQRDMNRKKPIQTNFEHAIERERERERERGGGGGGE